MTTKVHFIVMSAMRNPPIACPETDAVRKVAWFKVMALANFSCPTILGIITGTIGPMKALQIPVKNIIP